MKITAVLLLIVFTLLQVGPGISSFFSDEPTIVLIDEEKHKDSPETGKTVKKDFFSYFGGVITPTFSFKKKQQQTCAAVRAHVLFF